jgi:hypothetical protein
MNFDKAIGSPSVPVSCWQGLIWGSLSCFINEPVTIIALLRCTLFGTAIWSSTSCFSKPFVRDAPEPFIVPYCMATVIEVGGRHFPLEIGSL